jgi:hypothetical protein
MSDTFDQAMDAWGPVEWGLDGDFESDPLRYHTKVCFLSVEANTPKAYLLRLSREQGVWVPRSVCRFLDQTESSVFVHSATYLQCKRIDLTPAEDSFEVLD